ncbi:hypothetical protein EPVG_00440 [Emiliania huxleyi virus 201]|nr:hypothetical protein ELVG_00424 [Emiliania huxleyi virus 203]AEP15800.1 hypothetical protein EQVG_00391 [Emiliania huxleyi virus 207]AEP16197.1 hypothetical protein ERVG_00322 [Emiliania huxleyi virus 208]AET98327.1 hypothetical protein EPVG_00440 [Emiliania huxleyi virus 201]
MSTLVNVLVGLIVIGLAVGLTISLVKLNNVSTGAKKYDCAPGTKVGPLGEKCIPELSTICTGKLEPGTDSNCVIKAGECATMDGTQTICSESCCTRIQNMKWENGVCVPKANYALCPNDMMSSNGTCVEVPATDGTGGNVISCGECTTLNDAGDACIMSTDPACVGTGATPQSSDSTSNKTARDAAIALAVIAVLAAAILYFVKLAPQRSEAVGKRAAAAWEATRGMAGSAAEATGSAAKSFGSAAKTFGSAAARASLRIPGVSQAVILEGHLRDRANSVARYGTRRRTFNGTIDDVIEQSRRRFPPPTSERE